jgi:hypothetical protein
LSWRAIVTAASAALALAGCATGTTNGFAIDVPAGWADRTSEAEVKAGRKEFELVLAPEDDDSDTPPTMTVSRAKLRDGDTLEDVVRVQRKDAEAAKPTAPQETRLAGEPAQFYDFAAEGRRGRTLVAIRDGRTYALSLVADDEDFAAREAAFRSVAESWRWEAEGG